MWGGKEEEARGRRKSTAWPVRAFHNFGSLFAERGESCFVNDDTERWESEVVRYISEATTPAQGWEGGCSRWQASFGDVAKAAASGSEKDGGHTTQCLKVS